MFSFIIYSVGITKATTKSDSTDTDTDTTYTTTLAKSLLKAREKRVKSTTFEATARKIQPS